MAHDRRPAGDRAVGGNGDDLLGPLLQRVLRAVVAPAVARQVDGQYSMGRGEPSGDVCPPMGVGTTAVDEEKSRAAGLAPRVSAVRPRLTVPRVAKPAADTPSCYFAW